SPLDFVAYLQALKDLGREDTSSMLADAVEIATRGMKHVDLLVVLPLNEEDGMDIPDDEDPELREAMNAALLEIVAVAAIGRARVLELTGSERQRLAALERETELFA